MHESALNGLRGGDGTAKTRARTTGCHYQNVGDRAQHIDEKVESRGLIAVVVGKKDKGSYGGVEHFFERVGEMDNETREIEVQAAQGSQRVMQAVRGLRGSSYDGALSRAMLQQ